MVKKLRDPIAKIQVVKRVNRLEDGNFGDHKFCREGVWELRIDQGAGTVFTMRWPATWSCCCCSAVTKAPKTPISDAPLGI